MGLYTEQHVHPKNVPEAWQRDEGLPLFVTAQEQLNAYFGGELQSFALPLKFEGTTFQQQVWTTLQTIPFGTTTSYGRLAESIGSPKAVRAVGLANGKNPISIIVPCHRVIGANGSLTGYGGGLECKQFLLEHEARTLGARLF